MYFSRPSFADVVAINLKTGKIRWRTHVDGYRADHMALSPDGRRLLVSASTRQRHRCDRHAHRPDHRADPVRRRAAREQLLPRRGAIFHASIGTVYTDTDDPSQDATKGERIFEVIDARTIQVLKRSTWARSSPRPATRHERRSPADGGHTGRTLRLLPGLVLLRHRPVRPRGGQGRRASRPPARRRPRAWSARLPAGLRPPRPGHEPERDQALRRRDDVRLRGHRHPQAVQAPAHRRPSATRRTGRTPARTATTASSRSPATTACRDLLQDRREVARIKVGDHPQRMRTGVIRRAFVR